MSEMQDYKSSLTDAASRKFETFSYLPEMTQEQICSQVEYIVSKGWNPAVEHTEPQNAFDHYWYMWKLPMFGETDVDKILDEVVEARQDTTVVIHPLTDHRRNLPLEKKGEVVEAHPDFQLVISYNPGYQSLMKDLKQSTKQRFGALDFDYPSAEVEAEIIAHEAGSDQATAEKLVQVAHRSRNLKGHGLDEGMSTRLLVYAAQLIAKGIEAQAACQMALVRPLTDDPDMRDALDAAVGTFF